MELIRATSPLKGRFFVGSWKFSFTRLRYLHGIATFFTLLFQVVSMRLRHVRRFRVGYAYLLPGLLVRTLLSYKPLLLVFK